jgi:uncharacterized protein
VGKEFLGQGWKFPIEVTATGDVATSQYEDNIRESIRIILMTAKGERVMRPDFGAGLQQFVFETINSTAIGSLQSAIQNSLIEWEPRIQLLAVNVEADRSEVGRLLVNIDYRVRATNTSFNLVFPFYLQGRT